MKLEHICMYGILTCTAIATLINAIKITRKIKADKFVSSADMNLMVAKIILTVIFSFLGFIYSLMF